MTAQGPFLDVFFEKDPNLNAVEKRTIWNFWNKFAGKGNFLFKMKK